MSVSLKFPRVLAEIIGQYLSQWEMIPWVAALYDTHKHQFRSNILLLWQNPNAIDMCIEMNLPMSWTDLSANSNPWAIARLEQCAHKINWELGSANPGLDINHIDIKSSFMNSSVKLDESKFRANPNDRHVQTTLNYVWIDRFAYQNPNDLIIDLIFNKYPDHEYPNEAWSNPNDRMFKRMINSGQNISWSMLSANSHPGAIRLLEENQDKIYIPQLLTNPGIFEFRIDPKIVPELTE